MSLACEHSLGPERRFLGPETLERLERNYRIKMPLKHSKPITQMKRNSVHTHFKSYHKAEWSSGFVTLICVPIWQG